MEIKLKQKTKSCETATFFVGMFVSNTGLTLPLERTAVLLSVAMHLQAIECNDLLFFSD